MATRTGMLVHLPPWKPERNGICMLLMMIISTESYLPDYNAFLPSKL